MHLSDYQYLAHKTSHNTAIGGDLLLYPTIALGGEVGEFLNKVKKIYRDSGGVYTHHDRDALIGELGDVLWYVAEIATQLSVDLSAVADANIEKLHSRQQRGVIGGNGDNR
jgi:NTP pyrophosphatase (non-canonical NTP hydrolase)